MDKLVSALEKFRAFKNHLMGINNNLFTLWISDNRELPELQYLSLKSMLLTGHNVTLYTYNKLNNIPEGINVADANEILNKSKIFKYRNGFNSGSYAGFSDWFRIKCLYENGTAWFDCDILAIKNINDFSLNDIIISSEYYHDGNIQPNNGFLKFKKKDKLVKDYLDYIENIEDIENNVLHGELGPKLIKSMLDNTFSEYYDYLMNPNFIAPIHYFNYEHYLMPSNEIVGKLKFDEIWGFHILNSMFRHYKVELKRVNSGFYYDLKEIIITSSTKKEYKGKILDLISLNNLKN